MAEFVPPDFEVPLRLETAEFVLEPLGPEHNEADYDAWTSSMAHIGATPGFSGGSWPREMTVDENRTDLQRHAADFRNRTGFTYTVLDPASRDVIGCVYIYPLRDSEDGATVLSWVRASHAPGRLALERRERVARVRLALREGRVRGAGRVELVGAITALAVPEVVGSRERGVDIRPVGEGPRERRK